MIDRQIIKNRATPIWNCLSLGFQHILDYMKYLVTNFLNIEKKWVSTFVCILDKLYLIVYTRNVGSEIALINK